MAINKLALFVLLLSSHPQPSSCFISPHLKLRNGGLTFTTPAPFHNNILRAAADSEEHVNGVNGDATLIVNSEDKDEDVTEITTASEDDSSDEDIIHPPSSKIKHGDDEPPPTIKTPPPPPPPAGHTITSENGVHTLTIELGIPNHPPLTLQSGKIGRQAAGAITLRTGDSVLYATAAFESSQRPIDFLPLSVEHQERFSSAGMTSGSYNKRDGRPAEHEILVCRLIDRPIRPLIDAGWRHDTQLLSWVLSYDGVRSCDALAIVASSAALWISEVPLAKPVAAVVVGLLPKEDGEEGEEEFVLNPTNEQMEESRLNLVLAGTKDAVLMIEGAAEFLPEKVFMEAVAFGHEKGIKVICEALEDFGAVAGKTKKTDTLVRTAEGLQERVMALASADVDDLFEIHDKDAHSKRTSEISASLVEQLESEFPDDPNAIKSAFKNLLQRKMYEKAVATGTRVDGRNLDQIRPITVETSLLPRVHGSSLFTRGETQAIATATLGDAGMKQKIDKIDGQFSKRFYLQYTFPPSCVGETGRVGAPGRREVGHGNLAERALIPTIPSEEDFPYTIRVGSLITESHGSSSMASVCGGTLALMDAGVPIKKPIAGIAMGMLLPEGDDGTGDAPPVILSDILGTEDALGAMDFKVAGDDQGITTFQLDIKCEGLTLETMERALEQARQGRLHILEEMNKSLSQPRTELPPTVPRMKSFSIDESAIGKVIGPGGKQIRAIIEDFGLTNMDVGEDGTIQISSMNSTVLDECITFIQDFVAKGPAKKGGGGGGRDNKAAKPEYTGPPAEEGQIYKGKITGVHQFGVFVEILPPVEEGGAGLEGLCHVSELHIERIRNCEAFMNSMNLEFLEVKYLGVNNKGQLRLSRKAVLEERRGGANASGGGGGGRGRKGKQDDDTPPPPKKEMDQGEVDAIAEAIQSVFDD